MIATALSIAGSDPSGGAGIQADLKAFSARGVYGMAALTALTAQNTRGVSGVSLVEPAFVAAQIAAVREDVRIGAVKIGMIGTAAIAAAVAGALEGLAAPVVVDPVMVAKGGQALLADEAVVAVRDLLLPLAAVVTPNLPEAAALLGEDEATDRAGMEAQARRILDLGAQAVLIKGGHLAGADSPDVLVHAGGVAWFDAVRVPTANTHGTGCSYSAAIAAELAKGLEPVEAVRVAKAWLGRAIAAADSLEIGSGHGPVHHFVDVWGD